MAKRKLLIFGPRNKKEHKDCVKQEKVKLDKIKHAFAVSGKREAK